MTRGFWRETSSRTRSRRGRCSCIYTFRPSYICWRIGPPASSRHGSLWRGKGSNDGLGSLARCNHWESATNCKWIFWGHFGMRAITSLRFFSVSRTGVLSAMILNKKGTISDYLYLTWNSSKVVLELSHSPCLLCDAQSVPPCFLHLS